MPVVYYPAIIERGTRPKSFGVFFPDLPGCTSGGGSAQDVARNADDALRGHLLLMIEDGDHLPPPSDIARIEQEHGKEKHIEAGQIGPAVHERPTDKFHRHLKFGVRQLTRVAGVPLKSDGLEGRYKFLIVGRNEVEVA